MIQRKEKIYASFILYYEHSNKIKQELFHQLEMWIDSYFEYYEIIFVNNTTYTQSEILQHLNPNSKDILFLDLGGNHLQNHALRAGIEFSKGDSVFIIADSNIPDLINQLKNMYEYHNKGCDIVILNTPYSKWKHRLFLKFISKLSKDKISQHHDLLFLISKRVVNIYSLSTSRIFPITALLRNTGYSIFEFHYKPQNKRISLLSKDEYTLYMITFSDFLPQFAFTITLFCFTISLLGIVYAVIMFLFNKNVVPGWTTLFLLLSFGLSGIFMILSILVRYLGLFSKEIQNTPIYSVKQITKL